MYADTIQVAVDRRKPLNRHKHAVPAVLAAVGVATAATLARHGALDPVSLARLAGLLAAGCLAVAACCLRGAATTGTGRVPWILLGAAGVVELAQRWSTWSLPGGPARLSWVSAGPGLHLVAAALAAAAVVLLRAPCLDRAAARRSRLDAATMVVAVGVTLSDTLLSAAAGVAVSTPALVGLTSVAAADALLAVVALLALSRARHPDGVNLRTLLPLCAGLAALAAGDAGVTGAWLSGGSAQHSAADFFVIGAFLLMALAATGPSVADEPASMARRERIAVCAAVGPVVIAALALGGYETSAGRMPTLMVGGVLALATLLLARLIVALLDNLVLSRTLESQVAKRTLELVTREQWFRSLVQHSSDVVTVVDVSGVVRYASPAAQRLFGVDAAGLVGGVMTNLVPPSDARRMRAAVDRAVGSPGASFLLELAMVHADGTWRETETVITSLVDVPDVRGIVLNIRDVTERKQLQERLTHQAFHDGLTGLANRSLFQQRLGTALSEQSASRVAVLFCDLDGFKAVNDSQGHDVGDALLQLVSDRLRRCVRDGDVVARFGGDEFAVLVQDVAAEAAAREVAERIEVSLRSPFSLADREVRVGVSVGIAVADDAAESVDVLLRNADLAMYRAKADRHAAIVVFEPEMHDALLARLQVEDDLRKAIGEGQLVLHYQPTVELASGIPVGAEALMRWYRPGQGIVSPHEFISVAEDSGFIDAMGQWALFEACRQAVAWQQHARPGSVFSVGVNISARQVTPKLVDVVAGALAESGLTPSALLLEMTESVLLGRTDEAVEVLRALKRLGVRIAIDDFGTGFSSLSYLSRFPVDVLKIDKHFIADSDRAGERAELARTIVHLGRSLRLATIAEGIETAAQRQALLTMGCDYGQGYLFSRPLPGSGLSMLLAGETASAAASRSSYDLVAGG